MHPLDAALARYEKCADPGGYTFLPNLRRVSPSPYIFAPGLTLRPATLDERDELRSVLAFYLCGSELHHLPWENEQEFNLDREGTGSVTFHPLATDEHHYHVLAFEGTNVPASYPFTG